MKQNPRIGIVLSGGPAPGGHNVICGLWDALHAHGGGKIFCFVNGARGIVNQKFFELTQEQVESVRNTGGFTLCGTGRDRMESESDLAKVATTCQTLDLEGLVIVGGDDSNTNALHLSEYFQTHQVRTSVVGVPKTIDGDLQAGEDLPISFGFDTATKVYAGLVSNIAVDAASTRKSYHFVRLMGRSASHITLEVAWKTQPTWAFIAEEVLARRQTLRELVQEISGIVQERHQMGLNHGVILIPEGIVEFILDFKALISEIQSLLRRSIDHVSLTETDLTKDSLMLFQSLPFLIREQLFHDPDAHGNLQLSRIESEKLLAQMVDLDLRSKGFSGKFNYQTHFFGYEGRSAQPSDFDAAYCMSLGKAAFELIAAGKTGHLAAVKNLHRENKHWQLGGIPIASITCEELRHGIMRRVIAKALVNTQGPHFEQFRRARQAWSKAVQGSYHPGLQYKSMEPWHGERPHILGGTSA